MARLATCVNTRKAFQRIGIIRALEKTSDYWKQQDILEKLIQAGFDLNGFSLSYSDRANTPLLYAINAGNLQLLQLFIDHGAYLEPYYNPTFSVSCPFEIVHNRLTDLHNRPFPDVDQKRSSYLEILLILIKTAHKRQLPIPMDIIAYAAEHFPKNTRLIFAILEIKSGLSQDESKMIAEEFSNLIFGNRLTNSLHELLQYGLTHLKSVSQWSNFFREIVTFTHNVILNLSLKADKDGISGLCNLLNQVYFHILCGMNPRLAQEKFVVERITNLLIKTPEELHDKLLLGLQVTSSLYAIETAIAFIQKMNNDMSPPPSLWTLEVAEDWFNYFAVYRTREGLLPCSYVLKSHKEFPELVLSALIALERIAIKRWNKKIENAQIDVIVSIFKTSEDLEVKNQAVKTLWVKPRFNA